MLICDNRFQKGQGPANTLTEDGKHGKQHHISVVIVSMLARWC